MAVVLTTLVLHRLAAITLLVALAPLTYASAACAGWSGSAAQRMACCQRSGDACPSLSADDCCADGEQRQNVEMGAALLVGPGTTTTHPVPAPAARTRSVTLDLRTVSDRPDIYLLDSVFLI